jgi:hypothetical protein
VVMKAMVMKAVVVELAVMEAVVMALVVAGGAMVGPGLAPTARRSRPPVVGALVVAVMMGMSNGHGALI